MARRLCAAGQAPVRLTRRAETRSDDLQATEPDPRKIIRGWGMLSAEVARRVSPILLLLRAAAVADLQISACEVPLCPFDITGLCRERGGRRERLEVPFAEGSFRCAERCELEVLLQGEERRLRLEVHVVQSCVSFAGEEARNPGIRVSEAPGGERYALRHRQDGPEHLRELVRLREYRQVIGGHLGGGAVDERAHVSLRDGYLQA